jgi:muramoyltetrapeptide carboxypeptidase
VKIGLFAPSSSCAPERYVRALEQAISLGHEVIQSQDPSANYENQQFLFSSDSAHNRIRALELLLEDNSIELILAARGGYGAFDLLSGLSALKAKLLEKPLERRVVLSGISDVTAVLSALDGIPNLALVHGPGFLDAFQSYDRSDFRRRSAVNLLELASGSWSGYQDLNLQDIGSLDPLNDEKSIRGKLLGGNLSVIASLVGTAYLPDFTDRILFLEETGEKPYRIHRALSQIKLAGLLNNLKAIVLGSFDGCVHERGLGPNIDQVFDDIFSDANYPVYKDFPGGHGELNLPLPFGVDVEVTRAGVTFI